VSCEYYIIYCMGHVLAGCLRELKNTMFCIFDARCYPFLKHLEGNKNRVMNILFINDGVHKF
jgi:hypothetical protein